MRKTIIAAILLSVQALPAGAALVALDDPAFGAGALTRDTASGLDWLDLAFSTPYSYNGIVAETGAGGLFAGFRLAEAVEVGALFAAAGLPATSSLTLDFAPIDALIGLLGATSEQGGFLEIFGVTATPSGGGRLVAGLDFFLDGGVPTYAVSLGGPVYGENTNFPTVGGWLVREATAVPEPPLAPMLAIGLLAWFAGRRLGPA